MTSAPIERPEQRAGAADDRREQGVDRDPRPVSDSGVKEQKILRIETACRRGDGGGDGHGAELDHESIDAECLGGILVLANGDQIGAEAASFDGAHHDQRRTDQAERDPIKRRAALELKRLGPQVELDQRADAGAGDRRHAGDDAQHLGESERHQREIRAFQPGPEAERADGGADQGARGDADDQAEPGIDAVAHLQDGRHIGAGAEERRVAERILAAIAAEQIPALAGERDQ